jgi:hypothetical protein
MSRETEFDEDLEGFRGHGHITTNSRLIWWMMALISALIIGLVGVVWSNLQSRIASLEARQASEMATESMIAEELAALNTKMDLLLTGQLKVPNGKP